ncbi:MAG: hypothetical protein L0K86_05355 [Actinomycetia bacterium]|nr:hypothetical protein [Actinomycetes bacterium]
MTRMTLENLVVEVAAVPETCVYRWYELDLDAPGGPVFGGASVPVNVIAATTRPSGDLPEILGCLSGALVTHVQFETTGGPADEAGVAAVRAHGRIPVPALHVRESIANAAELAARVRQLARLDAPIVKLVYPAPTVEQVWMGLAILRDWPDTGPRLSLTPAGSRQGRVAAALAGSRLTYVPLDTEDERMPADWWRSVLEHAGVRS